jgi:hypothetical protein
MKQIKLKKENNIVKKIIKTIFTSHGICTRFAAKADRGSVARSWLRHSHASFTYIGAVQEISLVSPQNADSCLKNGDFLK